MHLRLAVPSVLELTVVSLANGAIQLGFLAAAWARARRRPPLSCAPSVQVIVPCKGVPPGLSGNAAAFRDQDYAGAASILFVVPDRADPAFAALERACAAGGRVPARLAAADRRAPRRPGKAADLAWALRQAGDGSELVVFADADQEVGPGWLAALTAPLSRRGVLATSAAVPVPAGPALWGSLQMLWVAWGLPFFDALGMACGHSLAARREDLAAWDAAGLWERVVLDDLALAGRARERGAEVVFVYDAMPASRQDVGARDFWALLNKWTMFFRFYERRLWVLGALLTFFKAYCLWRAASGRLRPGLLAAVWVPDALYAGLLLAWLSARRPENYAGFPGGRAGAILAGVLAAPLIPLVHLVNFGLSLGPPRLRWGGRTYRFRAADDFVVEEGARD